MKILSNPNVYDGVSLLMESFTGWFDAPTWGLVENLDVITLSGWLIPKKQTRNYHLRIGYPDGTHLIILPTMPRPEVPAAYKALPLKGASEFCGFFHQLPVADELTISVIFEDGQEVFWTKIQYRTVPKNFENLIIDLLTNGYDNTRETVREFNSLSEATRFLCIDYYFHHIKTVEVDNAITAPPLNAIESSYFKNFLLTLNSVDFFSTLLESYTRSKKIELPNPFGEGSYQLVQSHFQEDLINTRQHVNYLVFQSANLRFYIEQHMHSIDCVFFPDRKLAIRFPQSGQFTRSKIKRFFRDMLIPGETTAAINIPDAEPQFGGVIMNALSPHHFFYDFLPAIDIAFEKNTLSCVPHFYGLEGMCYFPLEKLYGMNIPNSKLDWRELKKISNSGKQYFITAGVSHKIIPLEKTKAMDRRIVETSLANTPRKDVVDTYSKIKNCSPIFWIGISAYGRSWLNQEAFMKSFIPQLQKQYPNAGFIFDGVTSHTYALQYDEPLFKTDQENVNRICSSLADNSHCVSLVGMSSIEKIFFAQYADFSFTNISTGTIYTSRFFNKPGVGHIGRALLYLEDLVGRFNKSVVAVPKELIHDVKNYEDVLDHSELDYLDYSIEENGLRSFLIEKIESTISY